MWLFWVKCGNETCYRKTCLPHEFQIDCNNSQYSSGDSDVYAFDITADIPNYRVVSVEIGTDIQDLRRTRKMMISVIILCYAKAFVGIGDHQIVDFPSFNDRYSLLPN